MAVKRIWFPKVGGGRSQTGVGVVLQSVISISINYLRRYLWDTPQ